MEKQKKQNRQGVSFATGLMCFALLLGIYVVLGMLINPRGSGSGDFAHYVGPVLPMTSLDGAEGVEVQRNVNFDFACYENPKKYAPNLDKGAAGITDSYILTNTTGETQVLELVYSFLGQFIDHPEEFPTITVDGVTVAPVLYPAVDQESLARNANNFETWVRVLEEQNFLAGAMAEPELADQTLLAYHFTDLAYTGEAVAPYPMFTVTFMKEQGATLWTDWVDVISSDDEAGTQTLLFRVDRGEAWIFTTGGELKNLTFGGNRDYNLKEESIIDGVTYKMETYETTLGAILTRFAEVYDFWAIEGNDYYPNPGLVTPEILMDGAIKRMSNPDWVAGTEGVRMISGVFHEVVTEIRMMYLVFRVELAPGASVTVEAAYIQEPSYDISGPKEYREGYELATRLGSDLNFTALTSGLTNTGSIELGEQNFGFDLEKGVTAVTLDLNVERYYLEVSPKKP